MKNKFKIERVGKEYHLTAPEGGTPSIYFTLEQLEDRVKQEMDERQAVLDDVKKRMGELKK